MVRDAHTYAPSRVFKTAQYRLSLHCMRSPSNPSQAAWLSCVDCLLSSATYHILQLEYADTFHSVQCRQQGKAVACRAAQSEATEASTSDMPEVQRWEWLDSDDAIKAHAALAGCLALGAIPWTHQFSWACVVYFISLAVCSIYIGAHKGLTAGMRQQLTVKEARSAAWQFGILHKQP